MSSLLSPCLWAEDDTRDFGIRVGAGAMQGIDNLTLKALSVYADMYLLNPTTRMIFGFSLYDMKQTEIPTMAIQSIGLEQNFDLPVGQFLLGVLYNKTYLRKESIFDPKRGLSFHTGYKYPLALYQDLVFTVGQQYKPLSLRQASNTKLDDKTWYAGLALEWYF